jgi:hypothetical protein
MEWSKHYRTSYQCLQNWILMTGFSDSDIIHLNVAGTSIIVLSSSEAAVNLLEKRSAIYSDRQAAVSMVSSPLS